MKTLYIDCGMGAAGDMLTAALVELLPDPDEFIREFNSLNIPNVIITKESSLKCGITGTRITVKINGEEEDEELGEHLHHNHENNNEHKHLSRGINEIKDFVIRLNLDKKIEADVLSVYNLLTEAESNVHGIPVEQIVFNEVGMLDAISDITAVCLLINRLNPDEIIVSPIHVGSGHIKCSHGILPVPAPATAYILKDVPIYGGGIKGELCTPTGAALLKHFASRYGNMPVMETRAIGYGMGSRDYATANCVRVFLGDTEDNKEIVTELICNVDDMTAEAIGFAMDRLFEGGALDVFTTPAGMKKNRPGTLINVICTEDNREKIILILFKHTTTIGIRETIAKRYVLKRYTETITTPYGKVHFKKSSGYGVSRTKYEYDDISRIARELNISLNEALKLIEDSNDKGKSK